MSPTPIAAVQAGRRPAGQITFLGAGPGDPGLLTLRAVEVLAAADVLVADPLTAATVRTHCPDGVELHDAHPSSDVDVPEGGPLARLFPAVQAGKHVVRTVDGDPGLDGRAAEEMLACAQAGIPFQVVPGVAYDGTLPPSTSPGARIPAIYPGLNAVFPPHGSYYWIPAILVTLLVGGAVALFLWISPLGSGRAQTRPEA